MSKHNLRQPWDSRHQHAQLTRRTALPHPEGLAARVALLLLVGLLAGCKPGATPGVGASTGTNGATRTFQVKGVVHEIMPDKNRVRIAHEEIPGYMKAMTMPFDVKTPADLTGIKPGDTVSFRMVVTDTDGWIENIVKQSTNAPQPVAVAPDNFRVVRDVEPLDLGDPLPAYHFTNELGQAINLADYKGQAVGITFIFTRCPFPTFCPRMSTHFKDAQKKLLEMPNAPTNWHLFTITFDPEFDTPAVLKQYGQVHGADPAHWSFLTGDLVEITAIAEQFGLLFWRPDPKEIAGISHNLRTVVIDSKGRVYKVLKEADWKPEALAATIIEAANPNVQPASSRTNAPVASTNDAGAKTGKE